MINKLLKILRSNLVGLLLTLVSILVISVLHLLGVFDTLELKLYDYRFNTVRGPLTSWTAHDSTYLKMGTDIVLVEVDDEAWRLMPEEWPYPRGTIWSQVIRNLYQAGARVIAFDIQFDAPDKSSEDLYNLVKKLDNPELIHNLPVHGDVLFGKAIAEARAHGTEVVINVKLVTEASRQPPQYIAMPVKEIMKANPETGLINDYLDEDGFSRRYALAGYLNHEPDKAYLTLGLKCVKAYADMADTTMLKQVNPTLWNYGPYEIKVLKNSNNFLVNYYGPASGYKLGDLPKWGTFPQYSLAYIIDTEEVTLKDPVEDIDWMDQFLPGKIPEWVQAIADPAEREEMMLVMGLGSDFDITKSPFYNKIVLIGVSVEIIHDVKSTPFYNYLGIAQLTPGVETHANAIQTILHGNYIRVLGDRLADIIGMGYPMSHSWLLALICMITFLLISFVNPVIAFGLIVIEIIIYFAVGCGLFTDDLGWFVKYALSRLLPDTFVGNHRTWFEVALPRVGKSLIVPLAMPIAGIILTYTSNVIYKFLNEQKDKKFLKNTFGAYISPELIDQMYEQKQEPKLGGDSGIKTAYFTDIQSFSSFSEILTATQLVELLNEYLTAMTDILLEQGGTLDKYEGDAIVAFFGAPIPMPDHAYRALIVALNMQQELARLREKWEREGEKWPPLVHNMRTRIGINSGDIVTGNMGSSTRMNYTMMGDVVNTAARLEASAKQYGIYIQLTKATRELAGSSKFEMREIDRVRVMGKTAAVESFELMSPKGDLTAQQSEMRDIYNEGLALYLKQEWDRARERFSESDKLEEMFTKRPTNPSRVYRERCDFFQANPPGDDWDGVWTLTTK